jgi:hypothetical protein
MRKTALLLMAVILVSCGDVVKTPETNETNETNIAGRGGGTQVLPDMEVTF